MNGDGRCGKPTPAKPLRQNYWRRALGAVLFVFPLAFPVVAALSPAKVGTARFTTGVCLIVVSCLIAGLNAYLSFVRPWLWKRRHGTQDGYRFVSGLPMLGTVLQVAGCSVAFGSLTAGLLGLASAMLDMGGLSWFVVATWRDGSFWGE